MLTLKRYSLIEILIDELKNLRQIEHTWHRSAVNFLIDLMGAIVAYRLMPNKPRLPIQVVPELSVFPHSERN